MNSFGWKFALTRVWFNQKGVKMLDNKISRRKFLKAAVATAVGTTISACAPVVSEQSAGQATEKPVDKAPAAKEVKILFHAGTTVPTDPKAKLPEGQKPKVVLQNIVDAYREIHPNVSVEWYRFPEGVSMSEWLTARIMAQDAPEVYNCNPEEVFPFINKGYALDFGPAYDRPNPYVSGNKAWKDQFREVAMNYAIGPDGKYYSAIMDEMGVMIAYNKTLFEKLGLDVPKSWGAFMAACEAIKSLAQSRLQAICHMKTGTRNGRQSRT